MTGPTTERPRVEPGNHGDALDFDYASRIDVYLRRAQDAEGDEKDFHVRHARQLLAACKPD